MAGSVNKVILVGTLGRDPECRTFQSGGKILSMSVATSERWKDKTTGEQKERTEWHKVSVTGGSVDFLERNLKKGSKVYIEGSLQTREYTDKSGTVKYSTDIVVKPYSGEVVLLDRAKQESQEETHKFETNTTVPDLDDEIPF